MPISPRSDFHHWSRVDSMTNRTAVYGPVRTVVWEGRRSDPSPYPDQDCAMPRSTRSLRTDSGRLVSPRAVGTQVGAQGAPNGRQDTHGLKPVPPFSAQREGRSTLWVVWSK